MSETTLPAPQPAGSAGIVLQDVTKRFPGQDRSAVNDLSMEIAAGDMVMLVGPSGCGKTTTLKMINRLIEPTSGRILLGGNDIEAVNADELRRGIGYVIQAGGLFPHLTVAANIAVVPSMLGWDKARTGRRVDELLELVSLDPERYRDRYPKELSGGQQQRVGVARALAADPPVLLMDEPFGAVDPITRERLQEEMLSLHANLRKTIVFVTHDFDEAIKLGDKIAVFAEGGHLVQYDSPAQILAAPANDFVRQFIGSDAGLKQLGLARVRDVPALPVVTGTPQEGPRELLARALAAGQDYAAVVDGDGRPVSWLSVAELEQLPSLPVQPAPDLPLVGPDDSLADALDAILVSVPGLALVTDAQGRLDGVIDAPLTLQTVRARRPAAAAVEPGRSPGQPPGAPAGSTEAGR
ncbi:ABC transporter ATP-binding protein [Arthrobacter sp. zg-Y820]|uniref:ABC transporter ATP-binding protein n=1 Tax=unclassified Arthrobacter TaxID=235627 RepID=UPI0025424221|nr:MULTISPECIES: ABC transporter ATP-binding protein [unclassified Arthrobacter]MCC9195464.1 ABC transporter ATP-binding protein [Arthrobacter sp. zg-Y820]MDK1278323.1 ABC transporter ATP-binding protein [Arthrobacter sp. zg.Y820]WIB10202.1 ABC transporter ATP-binding protein [Arthrobacter sp. zg-Y820]